MPTNSGPGSESSTNTSVTLKSLRLREPGLDPRPRYAFFAMPSALSQSGG
jgi:hypothetical protein